METVQTAFMLTAATGAVEKCTASVKKAGRMDITARATGTAVHIMRNADRKNRKKEKDICCF